MELNEDVEILKHIPKQNILHVFENLIVEGIANLFSDKKKELALPMFLLFGITRSNEKLFSAKNMWNFTFKIASGAKVILKVSRQSWYFEKKVQKYEGVQFCGLWIIYKFYSQNLTDILLST